MLSFRDVIAGGGRSGLRSTRSRGTLRRQLQPRKSELATLADIGRKPFTNGMTFWTQGMDSGTTASQTCLVILPQMCFVVAFRGQLTSHIVTASPACQGCGLRPCPSDL